MLHTPCPQINPSTLFGLVDGDPQKPNSSIPTSMAVVMSEFTIQRMKKKITEELMT